MVTSEDAQRVDVSLMVIRRTDLTGSTIIRMGKLQTLMVESRKPLMTIGCFGIKMDEPSEAVPIFTGCKIAR
jgi:hypothetical protein